MHKDEVSRAFHVWSSGDSSSPVVLHTEGVELHKGRDTYKSASVRVIGDPDTGRVHRRELKLGKYPCREVGPGYDFDRPDRVWTCDDEQINRLQALLNASFEEPGRYVRVDHDSDARDLIERLTRGEVDAQSLMPVLAALAQTPGIADALAALDDDGHLTGAIEYRRQKTGLQQLRQIVEDPISSERDLQGVLEKQWWMFGGRYVGQAARRKLTLLDQFDIPLIRSDGALHVVELKLANIPKLLVQHRNHPVVGAEVHLATAQAMSYLQSLDRQETVINSEFGLDCHRAFATVVIGHPVYATNFTESQVSQALRTYNSHLARIEVITYKELLDGAERALSIGE